jgi:hypothetical protein
VHRLAAVAVCTLVAACAGSIKEGMTQLEGQPLSAIIAKIGAPIEERTIDGKKVYVWGTPQTTPPSREKTCQIRATTSSARSSTKVTSGCANDTPRGCGRGPLRDRERRSRPSRSTTS